MPHRTQGCHVEGAPLRGMRAEVCAKTDCLMGNRKRLQESEQCNLIYLGLTGLKRHSSKTTVTPTQLQPNQSPWRL